MREGELGAEFADVAEERDGAVCARRVAAEHDARGGDLDVVEEIQVRCERVLEGCGERVGRGAGRERREAVRGAEDVGRGGGAQERRAKVARVGLAAVADYVGAAVDVQDDEEGRGRRQFGGRWWRWIPDCADVSWLHGLGCCEHGALEFVAVFASRFEERELRAFGAGGEGERSVDLDFGADVDEGAGEADG